MITEIIGKRDHNGSYIIPGLPREQQPDRLKEIMEDGGVVHVRVRPEKHLHALIGDLRGAYGHKIGEYFDHGKVRITLARTYDKHANMRLVSKLVEIGREPIPLGIKHAIHCLNPESYGCLIEEVMDDDEEQPAVISVTPSVDAAPPKPKRKRAPRKRAVKKPKES